MARSDGSTLTKEDIDELKKTFTGEIIIKGEADEATYNKYIDRWNKIHIKQANIIALCSNEQDVSTILKFRAKHDLDTAISGGRHTMMGASSGSGLVIDLRKINHVSIDKASKTVVAGGGCIASDVEVPAQAEGLMVPFGVNNETGIGGLSTGGGIGFLTPKYGLTLDNILSVRVATADGNIVVASEEENADLFWGIRGGGCNFGIVTEFTYRAYEQGSVFLGIFMFSMDKVPDILGFLNGYYEEYTLKSDGKLTPMFVFMSPDPNVPHMPAMLALYNGPEAEAAPYFVPIENLGPVNVQKHTLPYTQATALDKIMPSPPGYNRVYMSPAYIDIPLDLDIIQKGLDEFLGLMKKHGASTFKSTFLVDLRDMRKVASVPVSATAYASRYSNCGLIGSEFIYNDPAIDDDIKAATRSLMGNIRNMVQEKRVSSQTKDHTSDVNMFYANFNNGLEKIESVFGPNLPRLKELKKKWDPEVVFDKWFTIPPA